MEYVNHLDTLIRKSTFKVKEPYVDGWIDPSGDFHPVNSHHHVEEALRIIKGYDTFIQHTKSNIEWTKYQIDITNKTIDFLKGIRKVKDIWDADEYDLADILNNKIDDLPSEVFYNIDNNIDTSIGVCNEYIEQCNKDIKIYQESLDMRPSEVSKFKAANKNKGYDAAEYIIINHGYIAVENGYLIYRDATRKQLEDVECYVEKDDTGRCVICKLSEEDLIQKKKKMRDECLSLVGFYKESENRFHCPSGFTRRAYIRWENECYKCGLDPNSLIYH